MRTKILLFAIIVMMSSCKVIHLPVSLHDKFIIIGTDKINNFCIYKITKVYSDSIVRICTDNNCLYNDGDTITFSQINSLKN